MGDTETHAKEKLNFTGFSGYYGAVANGYGGFDYSGEMLYMNTALINREPWCYNGYVNMAMATGASAIGWIWSSAAFESDNLQETFSLKSMVAASAWNSNAEWQANSYVYRHGVMTLKASDIFYASQSTSMVDFVSLGRKSDFRNISAVSFTLLNVGSYGNTCVYGQLPTGYQIALGNLKVKWNGTIPHHRGGHSLPLPGEMMRSHHHVTPFAHLVHAGTHPDDARNREAGHQQWPAYHTQLLAFGHDPHGLTSEFGLPHVEHWGI
ncbi:MAG TPA: hypothetical protein VGF97_06820 [Rhizomicrobium sp.]